MRALSERVMALLDVFAHLARGALGGLERDIAGKAFGDDNIDLAAADIVAFDKPLIIEIGKCLLAQDAAGLAHRLKTLRPLRRRC